MVNNWIGGYRLGKKMTAKVVQARNVEARTVAARFGSAGEDCPGKNWSGIAGEDGIGWSRIGRVVQEWTGEQE